MLEKKRKKRDIALLRPLQNEDGFVLIAAIMTLLILIILGISSTTTTNVELQIAGNDMVNKQTFYAADAGTEVGARMVEENIACPDGFTSNVGTDTTDSPPILAGSEIINGQIVVERTSAADQTPKDFWKNEISPTTVSDTDRDIYYPKNYNNGPHTNLVAGGPTTFAVGSAIQMVSGYEGKGKGSAASGATINYTIISQKIGRNNSTSEVEIIWRHTIGQEGECNY